MYEVILLKVALIFTGGTIAMKVDKSLQGAIPSLTPNEIMMTLSGIDDFDQLITYEYSAKPSPFLTIYDMQQIANLTEDYLAKDDIAGVVIVHGTDTLEETAFFLHSVIQSDKPVVLTGSMKNASEFGYDGLTNLASSIKVCLAKESIGLGTLVVMNDTINSALEVTKSHTMSLDTFKSMEFGPLGIVDQGSVLYYRSLTHQKRSHFANKVNEDVYIIKVYAGMNGDFIDYLIARGAKGIVLESLGRGNVPPMMMDAVKKALELGVHVVISSRCPTGRVLDTYAYEGGGKHLTSIGCVLANNYNSIKARILLMLAIANDQKHDAIVKLFDL